MNILSGLKPYIVYIINIANKKRRSNKKAQKNRPKTARKKYFGKNKKSA
jgi:hypothetical protein